MFIKNNHSAIVNYPKIDLFIIFLVIITTVNPYFSLNKIAQLTIFIIIAIRLLFLKKNFFFNRIIILIFFLYTIISLIQGFIWSFSLFTLFSGFILVYLYAYFLFRLYGKESFFLIEKVLYPLTIFSIVIFLFQELIPAFSAFLANLLKVVEPWSSDVEWHKRGLIIYTYRPNEKSIFNLTRNCGFGHEPGAFAVFANLGIIINYIKGNPLFSKRNFVYFLAIATTFSTAGFLSVIVLLNLLLDIKGRISLIMIYIPIIILSLNFYFKSDIMSAKIKMQYAEQTSISLESQSSGRFLGARKSLYVLAKHPLFGRGLQKSSMPEDGDDPEYATYGWISYISKLGVVFGGLFLFFFLKGIYNWTMENGHNKKVFIIIAISIFINLSAQTFMTNQLFLIFLFFGIFSYSKQYSKI